MLFAGKFCYYYSVDNVIFINIFTDFGIFVFTRKFLIMTQCIFQEVSHVFRQIIISHYRFHCHYHFMF